MGFKILTKNHFPDDHSLFKIILQRNVSTSTDLEKFFMLICLEKIKDQA